MSDDDAPRTVLAKNRLDSINAHLRKYPPGQEEKEANWESKVLEIRERQQLARVPVSDDRGILRQKGEGKLWVRERIALLLDPGSFREMGSLAGSVEYNETGDQLTSFVASNNIIGSGTVTYGSLSRKVMVLADDFSVRGGHADGSVYLKSLWAETSALKNRIPMIRLLDGSSGGGSVKSYLEIGRTYVPPLTGFATLVESLATIPVCCALLGPVVGLAAIKATMSHFAVMIRNNSQLFSAGPPVVRFATFENLTKEELGGVAIHGGNGSVDYIVDNEAAAFEAIRRFLSYLPTSVSRLPPSLPIVDPTHRRTEELISIIPRKRARTYDIRRVIALIVDEGSFMEIGESWGRTIVVGLARVGGKVVGVVSSDCRQKGGTLDMRSSQKLTRHIDLCETFGLPLLNLVDQPGISVGKSAEIDGTVRAATQALVALYQSTIPAYTVILRRAFGVGGAGLVDFHAPSSARVAWPSGDWGSLPLSGGVEAAFKAELDATNSPTERKAKLAQLTAQLEAIRSPLRTAETFGIEEMIDPRDTRGLIFEWIEQVYEVNLVERLARRAAMGGGGRGYRP